MTATAASSGAGGRIPSLDGLRAISIVLVLFGHALGTVGFLPLDAVPHFALAELGVRIFFVISGFLITSLLMKEVAKTGTLSLRGFYIRRIYRILPASYVYVGAVLVLAAAGLVALRPYDGLAALTYTVNYHQDRSWWIGHLWSLSVEEQFYLLWPALVLFAGVRRGMIVAAAALFVAPALRMATWLAWPAGRDSIPEAFPTVCDAIATGCLLAGLGDPLNRNLRYRAFLRSPLFVAVPLIALGASAFRDHPKVDYLLAQTVMNLAIALCIDHWVRLPGGPVGKFLNAAPVAFVGTLSYSLYLWQQFFVNRHDSGTLHHFPLNIACAVAMALASYFLIERPFLRLRARRGDGEPPRLVAGSASPR